MAKTIHKLINETELFAGLANGDERAFEIIYHHYNKRLAPFVLKMIRSEDLAREIIQDIFVQLWINKHLLNDVQHPTSYLFNIAANKTLNYIKKVASNSKLMNKLAEGYDDRTNETEESVILRESIELIEKAVSQLPGQRRLIWEMSRNEGLTHEQIAERLNISKNTVKNQMGHALKYVRSYLDRRASVLTLAVLMFLIDR